jgi:hypothetical protein
MQKSWSKNAIRDPPTGMVPELFSEDNFFFPFFSTFFVKCRVKERERFRNASSYSAGQVVEEGDIR